MSSKIIFCLVIAGSALGCQSADDCKDFAASNDGTATWGQCGDKRAREVKCEGMVRGALAVPGKPVSCMCTVDGVVGKTFQSTDPLVLMTKQGAIQVANEQCGWHLK